ncbi:MULTISPECIES: peptidylprolyl isomerase [Bizionia]|uniref:Peptidyl-prolyl cis-trans isomerase n=1 Tax=Bizionia algoritergicola TaxID=291187 RepID=A0A5D0QPU0_9FLAO|nr:MULTISPECIES: peptidylprolyl isomerase [Bizionia]OBX22541.1 peptidylprolyl isomerase [Bizionia sp. APA-3]TYB70731.1 peptidylprolyl isomerase [Bizionia algoritergicola]
MIRILMLVAFIFFLGCEDKQSKPKEPTPKTTKTVKKPSEKLDSAEIEIPEFPFLTDENAMEFFLEYEKNNPENKVRITTKFGNIDILLFDKIKFHRANFVYLTKRGYFNGTQFYRVIDNFIIQAGNTDDPKIKRKRGDIGRYLLPPDTKRGFKHHRGIVSMPSSEIEDAYKLASPFEFFIVQNKDGAYHLDGDYTIFGEVISGMDVVDEIAAQKTDDGDWPLRNVYIKKVEIIK